MFRITQSCEFKCLNTPLLWLRSFLARHQSSIWHVKRDFFWFFCHAWKDDLITVGGKVLLNPLEQKGKKVLHKHMLSLINKHHQTCGWHLQLSKDILLCWSSHLLEPPSVSLNSFSLDSWFPLCYRCHPLLSPAPTHADTHARPRTHAQTLLHLTVSSAHAAPLQHWCNKKKFPSSAVKLSKGAQTGIL